MQTMSTEKTTTLSIVVGMAALLAEIIFRNIFNSSTIGVILSVVLALVILCCTYLVVDGLMNSASVARKKEENRKREYDEKMYRLLNKRLSEIVKLQKRAMGEEVTPDVGEEGMELPPEIILPEEVALSFTKQPTTAVVDNSERDRLLENINENIMKSAKFIVKYSKKNQEQTQQITEKSVDELLRAVRLVEREIQGLGQQLSTLSFSSGEAQEDKVREIFTQGSMTSESMLPTSNELSDLFNTQEPQEQDELSGLEEDIAADLLSARQEIQEQETEVRLEDILPEGILQELVETTALPEESEGEKQEELQEQQIMAETWNKDGESDSAEPDVMKETELLVEADTTESTEAEDSVANIGSDFTQDSDSVTNSMGSEAFDFTHSEETTEHVDSINTMEEEETGESSVQIPSGNLTAVDLLRIKQQEKEEAKKEEAQKIESPEEESPAEKLPEEKSPEEEIREIEIQKDDSQEISIGKEEILQDEIQQEEELLLPAAEIPEEATEDSNGIMSAEDIAALFASNDANAY